MNQKNQLIDSWKCALVIENESEAPQEVIDFCENMLSIQQFDQVEYNLNSRNESPEDMFAAIMKSNIIVVKSHFMYKDQLEAFIELFARSPKLPHLYTFYIWDFNKLKYLWRTTQRNLFSDYPRFEENLKIVMFNHIIYSINSKQ